jgi:hypothetical protein
MIQAEARYLNGSKDLECQNGVRARIGAKGFLDALSNRH